VSIYFVVSVSSIVASLAFAAYFLAIGFIIGASSGECGRVKLEMKRNDG